MTQTNAIWDQLRPYASAFHTHARLWIIPTIALTIGSIVYAFVMPVSWRASQAMVVRDEAIGNQNGQGQFGSIDWMKVFQEKILEVARSRLVVEAVLAKQGPPTTHVATDPWPTEEDILALQSAINVTAPQGAEFGRTEFFHLSVTGETPERALQLARDVCDELEKNLGSLRNANAQSMISELERALVLAQSDLDTATTRLEDLEREVGEDLGELRLLTETGSGDSNLRTTLNQVKQELRLLENSRESLEQIRELLQHSQENPENLLATPIRLLELQPGLRTLKDGLNAAHMEYSRLRGTMSASHPKVVAAERMASEIRAKLKDEVQSALRGIEADLAGNAAQIRKTREQYAEVQGRMDKLAQVRARYGNLVADTKQRTQTLDSVKQKLAGARAAENAASTTSQLTRFGNPVVGDRPVGPSKKLVVAGGMASGLALGSGLVLLFMPLGPHGGQRRWSDLLNLGRRATDQFFGRRATDTPSRSSGTVTSTTSPRAARRAEDRINLTAVGTVGGRRACDAPKALAHEVEAPSSACTSESPERDRRGVPSRRDSDPV